MAMQPLHHEIDPAPSELTPYDHPVLQGLAADQAAAYAEEVQLLRQRVAVLEAALAAAKATPGTEPTVADARGVSMAPAPAIFTSEFSEPVAPAVVAYSPAPDQPASSAAPVGSAVTVEPVANDVNGSDDVVMADQAFANAWSDGTDSSFEERIAQKAFFQVGSVDEESRKWLLTS